MSNVLSEILFERIKQEQEWGEQNHPDGTGNYIWTFNATQAKLRNEDLKSVGELSFLEILYEEVMEAFAETDPKKLRDELIQVAAVAVCWIESIDRRDKE